MDIVGAIDVVLRQLALSYRLSDEEVVALWEKPEDLREPLLRALRERHDASPVVRPNLLTHSWWMGDSVQIISAGHRDHMNQN